MAGKEIEKAFEDTTKIIFGKALTGLDKYEEWLTTRVTKGKLRGSSTSKKRFMSRLTECSDSFPMTGLQIWVHLCN